MTQAPIPNSTVLAQLGKILGTPRFAASQRLRSLLSFLVEEMLAGRGDTLIQYRIATEGLGQGESFDPENKTLVRAHAARLRKELGRYYETLGSGDPVVISLPATGYRVTFTAVRPSALGARPGREHTTVLALLEFKGIGLEGAWQYLPVWLAEELSLILCQSSHLRMLGPFSRQLLVREGIEAAELSQRHPADFILDGGIEQRGDVIVIRSRLLEASGLQIWSRRDECPLAEWDPARIEREIAQAIAVELGTDFGKIDRHLIGLSALNPNAILTVHEAVLRGKAFESDRSEECYSQGVAALENAVLNLTMTNIRSVMGSMDLDELLSNRDEINSRVLKVVDAAVSPWGIKITRIEIKDIDPPKDLVESMGRQMKAEREKRALILEAEGKRQAAILQAEGAKQSQVLEAEGRREAAFRDAEARERSAEAEARATQMVSDAIASGNVQAINYFVANNYIKALESLAKSPNQKVLMLPVEAASVIGAIGGIAEIAKETFGGGTPAPARGSARPPTAGSVQG